MQDVFKILPFTVRISHCNFSYFLLYRMNFDKYRGKMLRINLGGSIPTDNPEAYYPKDGKIKEFQNSLLVTGVKTGTLYRLPLDADAKQAQGEVVTHFRTDNRYRMVLVSPDTSKIYVATDNAGYIMGKDSVPTKEMANKGAILVFEAK